MAVYLFVVLALWSKCLPLAVVQICVMAASLLRLVIRETQGEELPKSQMVASDIAWLPVDTYIVYVLWSATGLAVLYGIVVLIKLFLGFLAIQNEELFD